MVDTRNQINLKSLLRSSQLVLGLGAAACGAEPATQQTFDTLGDALGVSDLVISQAYGGGGNSGAPYNADFVELFNRGTVTVSLTGMSVQYASATGSGNFSSNPVVPLLGNLAPGQHYLVQLATGATGSALPAADATGTTAMSGTAGKVALVGGTTGLACNGSSTACNSTQLASIVDLVGYGSANFYEGSAAAPALTNTTAAVRASNGCTDSGQNSSDFAAATPVPRNTASTFTPCSGNTPPSVVLTTPSNGASSVSASTNLSIDFSESVTAAVGWFQIVCTVSGTVSASESGSGSSYVLDPNTDFAASESCTVTISAAAVTDSLGAPMSADYVFSFATGTVAGVTPIHTIQGAAHLSPLNGSAVTTRGIVTATASNGYYLQDPVADADDRTSEAIFVFTSSAPTVVVGNDVQVSATVSEYRPGCSGCAPSSSAYPNLTLTELISPTVQTVLGAGQPLPTPIVIGNGGRVPPSSVIEDDAVGDVELVPGTFDPSSDGLDFFESLEAMRVQLNNAVAVGPSAAFSGGSRELPVVGDNGANAGLRTARGGVVVSSADWNPERVTLGNDLVATLPDANVGDTFPGAIVGVINYTFANYKLFYTSALPTRVASGVTQETLSFDARHPLELDIASFNVENLDALDASSKFTELAQIVVTRLGSPDIIGVEEFQDNDGAVNSGTVSGSTTASLFISAISAAGGPTYAYSAIDPVNNQDGGEPNGNIRVAFLYRTDRGLAFVAAPGAGSLTPNAVQSTVSGPKLQYSPGRIDPTNSAFSNSRKPLAGQFTFQGRTLFVIANHFNSKGGDNPLLGRFQPPALSSEAQRVNQATVVKNFVQQILALDANAAVVVLGDLNDFEFSAPLTTLKSTPLTTLIETLPANERYTYVYQGNSQTLDHIMVSPGLVPHVMGFDVVHANAEFAVQASDHDPGVARLAFDFTAPAITGPSGGSVQVSAHSAAGAVATFSVTALDNLDGALPVSCSPASGSTFALGTTQVTCMATDANGNTAQIAFNVVVTQTTAVPLGPALPGALGVALLGLASALRRRVEAARK